MKIEDKIDKYLNEKDTDNKSRKKLKFEKGALHKSLGIPLDQKIPADKIQDALDGKYGPKAKKQALFMKNVLTGKK